MSDFDIVPSAARHSLSELPVLLPTDRQVLERLLLLAPDVAVSTAAAVVRAHQPELVDVIFGEQPKRPLAEVGQLARALVYLGLAMAAPGQGKILPLLTRDHIGRSRALARFGQANQLAVGPSDSLSFESLAIPDPELREVLNALV